MKRTLLSTLVITSTLGLNANVFALGMGELELKSTLNQPLQAEIVLSNIDDLSEWEIKPSLASDGDFDRAGVEKIFFLSDIDFEIKGNRIVLSSDKSVTEPFLNFLVQVNWPSGRVLREYTLLLDPPVFDEAIQPLAVEQKSQRVETTAVVPAASQPNAWQTEAAAPGTYKVQKDDTLWEIAINTRPSRKVSPQQMMLAIQDSNPGAFINGNINRLKTHQTLRIPTQQQMAARNTSQALNEVQRQNSELKTAGAQLDATAKAAQTNEAAQDIDGGELKLLSSTSEVAKAAGASGDISRGGEGSQEGLQNDLSIALETLDTNKLENDELKNRLAALEDQIATLQRLVSLKDDQLASIQTIELQREAQQGEALLTEQIINEIPGVSVIETSDEVDTASEEVLLVDELTANETTETDFNYSEPEAQIADPAVDESVNELAVDPAVVDPALAADQIQQQIEDRYKPKGFVAELTSKPEMIAGLVGGIALLLGLIGLAWKKRRAAKEGEIEDSELAGFDENFEFTDDNLDDSSLDNFEFDEDETVQSDELNDDLLEGFGSEDATVIAADADAGADTVAQTADIIGEAEIYIAYGRFDQAADLLKNSIQQEPSRLDVRMKLLEVYVEIDDAESFAEAELDLNSIGDVNANEKAVVLRNRLTAPINGGEASISEDLMSEQAPDIGIEGLADADDEFAGGIDFEAALDFTDSEDEGATAEGQDFAASLDALGDLTEEPELDFGTALDFDLSENSEADQLPTLDSVPELDGMDELEDLAELEDIAELENIAELEDIITLDEEPLVDEISTLEEIADLDDVSVLDELLVEDDSLNLDDDIATLETTVDDSVVSLSSIANDSDDLSDLESLLDADDATGGDDGLPDLNFDLEETGFSEGSDAVDDLQSLEAELEGLISTENADLEELSVAAEQAEEQVETVTDASVEMTSEFDLDELEDLPDFTTETAAADVGSGADQEIDLEQLAASDNEFDFLAGTDECATKLDLARAYLDMEDFDGAKELLQEVVTEGNDQQKTDARTLMESIG